MDIVLLDLDKYLKRNTFPSRTVLVFPPFNGFRRFLIHKLIEDNFTSAEVAAFSIGQDISRRIVVCYKGLIRADQTKPISHLSMIDKEKQTKQRLTPATSVYRPPAARIAERKTNIEDAKLDSKRSRVRRPDQQMYVPRPKRASYGNDQPQHRSRSSSRTSFETDSSDKGNSSSLDLSEIESRLSEENETNSGPKQSSSKSRLSEANEEISGPKKSSSTLSKDAISSKICSNPSSCRQFVNSSKDDGVGAERMCSGTIDNNLSVRISSSTPSSTPVEVIDKDSSQVPLCASQLKDEESNCNDKVTENGSVDKMQVDSLKFDEVETDKRNTTVENKTKEFSEITENEIVCMADKTEKTDMTTVNAIESSSSMIISCENSKILLNEYRNCKSQVVETISISSDSRDQLSQSSSSSSNSDSRTSDSSNESEVEEKQNGRKHSDKMDIETSSDSEDRRSTFNKNKTQVSDVLVISSDSNSSSDFTSQSKHQNPKIGKSSKDEIKKPSVSKDIDNKHAKNDKVIDPDFCDWESLYDDSGECLVPDLMAELTKSVGGVKIASADSDYRPYQSIEERTNDGECVIEIYDFPAEFKTTDLFNIFAAYRNKNFQIKWVDDTHALGVFPSPLLADEVLACTLPFVKTRPLRLGIAESRNKARNLVLPPLPSMERPKTCAALARRLVTGALGLRVPTSRQDREKERQVLREAREKRRQEAKQREAAWDGTITSNNCI